MSAAAGGGPLVNSLEEEGPATKVGVGPTRRLGVAIVLNRNG